MPQGSWVSGCKAQKRDAGGDQGVPGESEANWGVLRRGGEEKGLQQSPGTLTSRERRVAGSNQRRWDTLTRGWGRTFQQGKRTIRQVLQSSLVRGRVGPSQVGELRRAAHLVGWTSGGRIRRRWEVRAW